MRKMNGALIIDKPAGMTSHDVVARVRRIIGERRVGHTGTLDPFATGVLVMLIGKATRLQQYLRGAEKEYEAVIRFGYATDTGDVTGQPLDRLANMESLHILSTEDIESAMASLRGEISQVPPMYSAKKVDGRKLYELARRGEQIERQAVPVTISSFEVIETDEQPLSRNEEDETCDLRVRVVCSAGTYVRTLAEDLGRQLGVGAHLASLRRTRAGDFKIEAATTLERLTELAGTNSISDVIITPDMTIAHLPGLDLRDDDARRIVNGLDIECDSNLENGRPVRLRDAAGKLIAVAVYDQGRKIIHPKVVIGRDVE